VAFGDALRRWLCGDDAPITTPEPANESDFQKAIHAAYIEVHKGKIDRTAAAATFVTTAAGAIGTLYTGLLALAFSVEATPARPLPARGLVPAVFLALAFFFSVLRIGFVRRTGRHAHILGPAETWEGQELRLLQFMYWVDRGALARAWALRIAVVCLGAAVALLPLPFLSLSTRAASLFIGAVTTVVVLYIAFELTPSVRAVLAQRKRSSTNPID
jgi:hypothetical protein